MLCSMMRKLVPAWFKATIFSVMVCKSAGFTPAAGSSSSTSCGSPTITRASSSSLRWPPDSTRAGSCSSALRPTKPSQCRAAARVRCSCAATFAGANQLAQGRSPSWPRGASMTFSNTDMAAKGRGIWKVRARPAANTRCGGMPVMSCPANSTRPVSGFSEPAKQLKAVVLPAPLGPTKPVMAPRVNARLSPCSTRWPPKALLSSLAFNRAWSCMGRKG